MRDAGNAAQIAPGLIRATTPKEEVIEWLKERDEVVSEATILREGYYKCISCGLVGNVNKPMPLSNLCCPQCGTQSQVEKV